MTTKNIMYVLGAVLAILGLLGFFGDGMVLNMFAVDTLHNLVHLAAGILAIWFASRGDDQARKMALILGVVFALLTVLGFLGGDMILGFIANNGNDNWLHLVLAVIFLVFGLRKGGSMSSAM